MTTPTDPPEWALQEADKYKLQLVYGSVEGIEFVDTSWKYVRSVLAHALDASRRRGIKEAGELVSECADRAQYISDRPAVRIYQVTAGAIRALADKEPT